MTNPYQGLADDLARLVAKKQRQYGEAIPKTAAAMQVLYPNGITPFQYRDALLMIRVIDKLSRLAQRDQDGADLGGESPWKDIAGYGLLGWAQDRDAK